MSRGIDRSEEVANFRCNLLIEDKLFEWKEGCNSDFNLQPEINHETESQHYDTRCLVQKLSVNTLISYTMLC